MSNQQVDRITRKQAMKQIATIAFPLFLYSVCNLLLHYAPQFLDSQLKYYLPELDGEMVVMGLYIAVSIFIVFVPIRIAAKILDLDYRAYLKRSRVNILKNICLCCVGIAIWFALNALAASFNVMIHSTVQSYAFVGRFNSLQNIIRNLVYILCFIIVRPMTEEYIFRAVAQRQLGHYSRFFGVAASSFLYAMVQPTLMDAICAFGFGWYLAIVTLRYHSIKPAIRIHVSAALFTWLLAVIPDQYGAIPLILLLVIYAAAIYSLFTRAIRLNIVPPGPNEGKLWKVFLKVVPVILCIAVFIIGAVLSFL